MDKVDLITKNKPTFSNWAVDGVFFGLIAGVIMFLGISALAMIAGIAPGKVLEYFSPNGPISPIQGFFSHLAVSAVYGILFGLLIWSNLQRFLSTTFAGWFGGLGYSILILVLAQVAILPEINSPLLELPFWVWAVGHGLYGLVLGGLFARKAA